MVKPLPLDSLFYPHLIRDSVQSFLSIILASPCVSNGVFLFPETLFVIQSTHLCIPLTRILLSSHLK